MDCLFCDDRTQVTNSRKSGQNKIWRRRQCLTCKKSFTTQETPYIENLLSISTNTSKKPTQYSHAKLELSILKACDHLVNKQELHIQSLVNTIENSLLSAHGSTNVVDSAELTQLTADTLKLLDKIAYLKYCANHNLKPDKHVLGTT